MPLNFSTITRRKCNFLDQSAQLWSTMLLRRQMISLRKSLRTSPTLRKTFRSYNPMTSTSVTSSNNRSTHWFRRRLWCNRTPLCQTRASTRLRARLVTSDNQRKHSVFKCIPGLDNLSSDSSRLKQISLQASMLLHTY